MTYNPANPNGQATMAASAPVVLPSDQVVPVTGSLLEELLTDLRVLVANMGMMLPEPMTGRTRVLLDAITATLTLATVTTVGTVSTVTSVTNVAQEGGQPANTNVGSLMNVVAYNGLRQQITVS